jgi:hypothetical protein
MNSSSTTIDNIPSRRGLTIGLMNRRKPGFDERWHREQARDESQNGQVSQEGFCCMGAVANKSLHPTAAALRFFGALRLTNGRRG